MIDMVPEAPRTRLRQLGRFRLVRQLGRGGMGTVFEAVDTATDARVALKTLDRLTADGLYYFKREYRALQEIVHPNLVRLGDLGEASDTWFFTMELLEGQDLFKFLQLERTHSPSLSATIPGSAHATSVAIRRRDPPKRTPDIARIRWAFHELALGLCAMHDGGKVHRDVKPNNVIVTHERRLVLLDFGLVADSGDPVHTEEGVRGTVPYMAPEQAEGRRVGAAADWYSLGVALFEALTGQLPFRGTMLEVLHAKQSPPPHGPAKLFAQCPPDLNDLCLALLSPNPGARPNGREILAKLAPTAEGRRAPSDGTALARPTAFFGRKAERDVLRAAFQDTRAGRARVVLVRGESGIGKTALIKEFAAEVQRSFSDVVVLKGKCHEGEAVPFKGVDGVIDALSHHLRTLDASEIEAVLPRKAGLLPRMFPVLERVTQRSLRAASESDEGDPLRLRDRTFKALRELLQRVCARSRLVIVVDDIQWTDADSLRLLEAIFQEPDAPPILLLSSLRHGAQASDGVVSSLSVPQASYLDLGTLDLESANALAHALLDRPTAEAPDRGLTAEKIASGASGHPLFIAELVRYVEHGGDVTEARAIDEAIAYRVRQLPTRARRLLEIACMPANPLGKSMLRRIAESSVEDFEHDWHLLLSHQLLRSESGHPETVGEPYHDRIRSAVTESLSPDTSRALHACIVHALARAEPDFPPELLISHLEGAGRIREASMHAERAARRAAAALAFDSAVELYQQACRLAAREGGPDTALMLSLADALIRAGRGREAAEALLRLSQASTPPLSIECRIRAAEQLMVSGQVSPGLRDLQDLLAQSAITYPRTQLGALLSILWRRIRLALGYQRASTARTPTDAEGAVQLTLYNAAVRGLLLVDPLRAAYFATRGLLLAMRSRIPFYVVQFLLHEAAFHGSEGGRGLTHYRRRQRMAATIAESSGDPILRGIARVHDGVAGFFEERDDYALRMLSRGEAILATATGNAWEISTPRFFQLESLRRQGKMLVLARRAEEYIHDAERREDRYTLTTIRRITNIAWLAADDVPNAERQLVQAQWSPVQDGYHVQHWYDLRARIELALYLGQAGEASWSEDFRALDKSLLLRVQTCRIDSNWLRGRLSLEGAQTQRTRRAEVRRRIRLLGRERTSMGGLLASILEANLAYVTGNVVLAVEHLDRAASASEGRFELHHACVALKRSIWLGRTDDQQAAAERLNALGVTAPHKMLRLLFASAVGGTSSGAPRTGSTDSCFTT